MDILYGGIFRSPAIAQYLRENVQVGNIAALMENAKRATMATVAFWA